MKVILDRIKINIKVNIYKNIKIYIISKYTILQFRTKLILIVKVKSLYLNE